MRSQAAATSMDQPRAARDPDESELLRLARTGDLAAFETLMTTHERGVLGLALRLTGNPEDARDAAQETFIRLYLHLPEIRESARPWLYTVTVNVCRDLARHRRVLRVLPMDDFILRTTACHANPERLTSAHQQESMLRRALDQLPAREREALVLRELEGLTTEEVAAILGSSAATVRSQISTARVKLRKLLAHGLKGAL